MISRFRPTIYSVGRRASEEDRRVNRARAIEPVRCNSAYNSQEQHLRRKLTIKFVGKPALLWPKVANVLVKIVLKELFVGTAMLPYVV